MKTFDLEKFQQTKAYDLIVGLPLIAWFCYSALRLRPMVKLNRFRFRDRESGVDDPV